MIFNPMRRRLPSTCRRPKFQTSVILQTNNVHIRLKNGYFQASLLHIAQKQKLVCHNPLLQIKHRLLQPIAYLPLFLGYSLVQMARREKNHQLLH
jgi:hypothetical protein